MKTNLKPFDLEAAKAGAPVQTRSGRHVRLLCFDAKNQCPIIGLISSGGLGELQGSFYIDGRFHGAEQSETDLVMAPVKRQGWVNLYGFQRGVTTGSTVHESESIARDCIESGCGRYVATVPVEWEE